MSRRNGIILGLLFVILVVEIIILMPKELGVPSEPVPLAQQAQVPKENSGQIMDHVRAFEAKGNGKEWELWADKALNPKSNEDWTIQGVRVKFYATSGVVYTVTGKTGHVIPNDKGIRDIQISGDVVTHASNGYVFKSQSALYDSQTKRLTSPSAVEMISPADKNGGEMRLTGADLHADFATNEITINKNVKTTKVLKDSKVAHIQSDRAKFSGRTNMAEFFGHVILTMDTMTVTGPEAKFAYDSNGEKLESVLVGGGVKMSDTDRYATSDSVNVDFKGDRVVFKGAPRVTQNGDELTGDEIVFLNGGHRVQVVNAKAQIDSKNAPGNSSPDKAGVEQKN